MRFATVAACLGAAALTAPAPGQDVIALSQGMFPTLEFGCAGAGVVCRITPRFDDFMLEFTGRPWKLVIIEWHIDLTPDRKARLLPALRAHLDGGGRLLLVYTPLDEWPELQDLVGIRTTFDLTPSLAPPMVASPPPHPLLTSSGEPFFACCAGTWLDSGDYLAGKSSDTVVLRFDEAHRPAALIVKSGGQVIVQGFEYDAYHDDLGALPQNQIRWLLTCHADVDGDGELTFFDFLAFQNHFSMGDLRADFAFDGRLDFFDFLEFQNQFAAGCP